MTPEKPQAYRDMIDAMVSVCQSGQGQLGSERALKGIWNENIPDANAPKPDWFPPDLWDDQRSINDLLSRLAPSDREVLARLLSNQFETGVFESLKVLEHFQIPPFEDGYEGSPYNDFIGRLADWPWPTNESITFYGEPAQVKITLKNRDNYLQLQMTKETDMTLPRQDIRVQAEVVSYGFSGGVSTWIDGVDFEGFLLELDRLDRELTGEVNLKSLSPDDFHLRIHSLTRHGHLAASGHLGGLIYPPHLRHRLQFSFEVDPQQLRDFLVGLRQISLLNAPLP